MSSTRIKIAGRLDDIGFSQTLAISARAKAMRSEGKDVIDFSIGEPDFPTPAHAKAAGIAAIEEDFTKYTAAPGIPDLRAAIAAKFERDNGLRYEPADILVSQGAKHSLFNASISLLDRGDEAIIPTPYWVSYPHIVRLCEGVPVFVPTTEADDFLLTPDALEKAITPRTKVMFLNNPSNPTGMLYTRDQLMALAEITAAHDIWVFADEIYEKLAYGVEFTAFASLSEAARERTITINGFSKAYAMTGWRLGYAAGAREVIEAMTRVQSQTTSSLCSVSQRVGVAALNGPQDVVDEMVAVFAARRDRMVERMRAMPGVECLCPEGAFYVFPNMTKFYDRLPANVGGESADSGSASPSMRLCAYLLEEAQVAVVPGSVFGAEDNIRLSYACSNDDIERGLDRIEKALAAL